VDYVASHGEVAMAYAAQYYLGDIGFIIIVGVPLSMLSAANATILAGLRVNLAWPAGGTCPPASRSSRCRWCRTCRPSASSG
jgi:amino acid transporter